MESGIIAAEESLIIETPERVPLEFALASIGNRFLAVAVDHFIQYLSIFVATWFFFSIAGFNSGHLVDAPEQFLTELPKWTIALLIILLFLIFATYFIVFEWLWNGQTPGKRLLKLRVIRDDGRPLTLWEAVTRNLLRVCDAVPGFIVPVYSVGLIAIFASSRDQRVGDIFAGTVVIRERESEAPTFVETFSKRFTDAAFTRVQKPIAVIADVKRLTDQEMEVVEGFLRRRWDLTERQRLWMAWRIALPLMFKLKPSYDNENFTYEGFLEEILSMFHTKQRFLN
jgi:uncharacterized RDD family membrane protein YckC